MNTRARGNVGERRAEEYLVEHGYEIVGRNVRSPRGEVDLVARKDDMIVFVEVKAWQSIGIGGLEEAIGRRKRHRIVRTAMRFMQDHGEFTGFRIRFDVVYVSRPGETPEHIVGAFDAD